MTDKDKSLYNSLIQNSIKKSNDGSDLDALDKMTLLMNIAIKEIASIKSQINRVETGTLANMSVTLDNKTELDKEVIDLVNKLNVSMKDTFDVIDNHKLYSAEDLVKLHENGKTWEQLDELIGGKKGSARQKVYRHKQRDKKQDEDTELLVKFGKYFLKYANLNGDAGLKMCKELNIDIDTYNNMRSRYRKKVKQE